MKIGKVLVGEDFLIKEAAEGNGGIFSSMKKNGILDDMRKKGIEWVFIGSVDNILLQLVDIALIGVAISEGTKVATKTIIKANPYEKVGVLCRQGGKIKVIEYTEIPKETAEKTNEQGELVFGESHIMCNLFNVEALEKAGSRELQYHVAFKKADYIDENGTLVRAEKENSYKFEKFIFDAFTLFDNISILRGKREEDFAPIKNQKGIDSPKTAKKLYEDYWKDRK